MKDHDKTAGDLERFELIDRLVGLEPEDREAQLAECEPELAADLRAMLGEVEGPGTEMLSTPPHLTPTAPPMEELPASIGPYRLTELLGEGGMGRVFLAEQKEPVRRTVALKLLNVATASREGRARFEAERHAMGRLEHPNIGKILDAGTTPDGLPYFAMELIDGEPITEFCNRRSLSVSARLRLFGAVCRGTDHAHRKLLLHRDLKPSNILVTEVDGRPVPKIIDFGIAKGLDPSPAATALTTGGFVGTPDYMSPEALGLDVGNTSGQVDIDTRSDVFSLGVVLFELLTDHKPWTTTDADTPLAVFRNRSGETTIPRPSTLVRQLDPDRSGRIATQRSEEAANLSSLLEGDLDWIVLTALAHEPDQRYSSAAVLARDIDHHLANEPIRARPPSARYLLRKYVDRNRGQVLAAALLALALIAGTIGTSVGLIRARAEAERANREASAAASARDRAVEARQNSDQLASYLVDLFTDAARETENPSNLSAKQLLDRGTADLDQRLDTQPIAKAVLLSTLGDIYTRWDDLDTANQLLVDSIEILEGQVPRPESELADALERLAELEFEEGDFEESLVLAQRSLSLVRSVDQTFTIREARIGSKVAAALTRLNRHDEARTLLERQLEALLDLEDETPDRSRVIGETYTELAFIAHKRYYPIGLEYFRNAIAAFEESADGDTREIVEPLMGLAFWLVDLEQFEEAESAIRRSLDVQRRLLGRDSIEISKGMFLLGRVLKAQQKLPEAEAELRRSLDMRQRLSLGPHPLTATILATLAETIYQQHDGRLAEVMEVLDEAENMVDESSVYPIYASVLRRRASIEMSEGNPEKAEGYIRRSIAHLEQLDFEPLFHLSTVVMRLAISLQAQDRHDEAEAVCRQSMAHAIASGRTEKIPPRRAELEALGCLPSAS